VLLPIHGLNERWDRRLQALYISLRALFHTIIERIDYFGAGFFEVPDHLKTMVYPDQYGMPCYRISLVGSYKMWIWWDGAQLWEEGQAANKTTCTVP